MNKNKMLKAILSAVLPSNAYVHSVSTDPMQQFMFAVTFAADSGKASDDALPELHIGFQKVSGISADLNVVEYHEGCTNYPMKLAGKASFSEATFERGLIPPKYTLLDSEVTSSFSSPATGSSDPVNILDYLTLVASDGTHRMKITIDILARDGSIRAQYILRNAFVSKWEAPDLDASSDDVAIEKITVQYEYFTYAVQPDGKGVATNWSPTDGEVKTVMGSKTFNNSSGTAR